jgi:enoyl-CoA hydratase/carnithine racemase
MSELFLLERHGAIATVTINRSERRNALTNAMLEELEAIARNFAADEQSRVVIIRATGDDFSVGSDIKAMGGDGSRPSALMTRRRAEAGARLMRSLQEIHQPTVCAVQGVATGGAACIATACDFRIATRTARMGYGEVKIGINLMWQALPVCVQLVGPARAKQLIMSGKLFPAAILEQWGFIDEICEPEELDARAMAWAEEYAALPPMAVQMIKRSINRFSGALDQAVMHADTDQWMLATRTEDFREALSAFAEKRPGDFKGN